MKKFLAFCLLLTSVSSYAADMRCSYQIFLKFSEATQNLDLDVNDGEVSLNKESSKTFKYTGSNTKEEYTVNFTTMDMTTGQALTFSIATDVVEDETGVVSKIFVRTTGLFSSDKNDLQLQTVLPAGVVNIYCKR